jgi:hypothetical protein
MVQMLRMGVLRFSETSVLTEPHYVTSQMTVFSFVHVLFVMRKQNSNWNMRMREQRAYVPLQWVWRLRESTFRRNMPPASSGWKNKRNKYPPGNRNLDTPTINVMSFSLLWGTSSQKIKLFVSTSVRIKNRGHKTFFSYVTSACY